MTNRETDHLLDDDCLQCENLPKGCEKHRTESRPDGLPPRITTHSAEGESEAPLALPFADRAFLVELEESVKAFQLIAEQQIETISQLDRIISESKKVLEE